MKISPVIAISAASLAVNVCVALLIITGSSFSTQNGSVSSKEQYRYLSPRIFVEHPNDVIINFMPLRSELRSIFSSIPDMKVGMYFEYLPSGVSIGINEKEEFVSASLLKVPFIMGVYKRMDVGALKKETQLTLKPDDIDPSFGSLWRRGAGGSLTVDEAVHAALQESDNTALHVLDSSIVTQDLVLEVFRALDLPPSLNDNKPVISAKNYSSIFRCLYLSCFLSYESSQEILDILTHSIFRDGIVAGVPENVPVAHKVGYYDEPDGLNAVRSDCGIVFAPKRPYLLCLIAKTPTDNVGKLMELQQQVSERVYSFISNTSDER